MSNTPLSLPQFDLPRFASLVQGGAALLWLPQAALLAWAIDSMLKGSAWQAALAPVAGVLLLGLLRAWAEAWGARVMYAAARGHLSTLRAQVAHSLAHRSPMDRQRAQSGQAASVMAEQAEAIVPYLVRYKPTRWKVMLVPLVILAVVLPLSWVAALILLIAAPLIPIFMALVGMGAQAASRAQMVEMGGMNAFLLDRLRGLSTLRALDAVDATASRLDETAQSLRRRTMVVLRIAFLSSAVLELFSALGVAMVAAYIGFSLLGTFHFGSWGHVLTLGEGMFILLLAPAFFEPLRELAAVWHDKAAGEAALAGMHELAAEGMALPGGATRSVAPAVSSAPPSIEIRQLHFTQPGEAPLFSQLDLHVRGGEHVALLGVSGAGKTTLLSLLAGLLPADGGEIRIGGVLMSDASVAALRQRMAWMGQRPHVFAASVSQNVTLGRTDADVANVNAALHLADLSAVAQARPSVMLSDGGHGLSGGEAVRLALARVVIAVNAAGADLLLVDEPTAHLDSETASRVTDALLALAKGKTMLVATHDPVLASRLQRSIVIGPELAMMEARRA
ncbi:MULTISPECIES: thiol reductant ABC exporter subunit CydD [unclassified Janthinobacterium]|uniref:thiol reductant ABC exporter subunit CydD n=1 Tax=unclassified Janthinobacterium TaxID=2610881 RepID=UPI001616A70B|nr:MULTISPECIES: thiol reductant ABC exporter subunit CydD [unclassified Janthinobacterium]MBB5366760.1 ATP-binding cassette subfamily C protein CydD [Janthinobacterium sp. K2C7]MBB5380762.1 ATP-binding cassette subfamily C protein CydD [Janthinobacterium sp. K2Li3]MBB5385142.1 ATP-binding cassette subfamily C protein CydD [Janthinobacterium sp. K2E3]